MDEVIEKDLAVLEKFDIYRNAYIEEVLTNKNWTKYRLDEIAEFRRGSFPQPYGAPEWYDEQGYPFVQVFDIDYNMRLKESTKVRISKIATEKSVFVPKGTLIVSIQGSIGRLAVTQYDAYVDRTILIFTNYLININHVFLAEVLSRLFIEKEKTAKGATIKTITKEELRCFDVSVPDIVTQHDVASSFLQLTSTSEKLNSKISASKALQKSLINEVF